MRRDVEDLRKHPEWKEGRLAAEQRKHFNKDCPYLACVVNVDAETFDREYRHRLDAWFYGWKSWLDEHGLCFNFKPPQGKKESP